MPNITTFDIKAQYIYLPIFIVFDGNKHLEFDAILDTGAPMTEFSDKALQYAQITDQHIAAGVMKDPVFMHDNDSLEDVFETMRDKNLSGLPVVDKNYHITGFITLLGLMAVCFPQGNPYNE